MHQMPLGMSALRLELFWDVEQVAAWDGTGYTTVYHIDETEG